MRGIPAGQLLTFEVSWDPVTYVYVDGVGTVRAGKAIFKLSGDDDVRRERLIEWTANCAGRMTDEFKISGDKR